MSLYNSDVYISIVTSNISFAYPSYSHFGQTNDQRSSRRNSIFFFRPIQREEASSLVPAGFAVIHHPPLRACSCLHTHPKGNRQNRLRGAPPLAPASRIPNLPRCACADLRCASPFPLRPAPLQGWGDPSACSCYPPPSPGGVRHVCHMPLPRQLQTAKEQRP
jgi:hypothetical protein